MRRPIVAGAFYHGERAGLERQLNDCFAGIRREGDERIIGAVVPHAGYMYSGSVASRVYAKLPSADIFVILGPNHQGMGSLVAVSTETWETPLGAVNIDEAFVDALPKRIIDRDENAHRYEHAIEVQLPFLQFFLPEKFTFVPICMSLSDEDTAKEVGNDLAEAITKTDKKVVMLASSDFTHYEPDGIARDKDEYVIEAIKELDVSKFYNRVYARNVTACGIGPIAVVMHAAKRLGAKAGELLSYATSGDITGDRSSVVGYAAITFS